MTKRLPKSHEPRTIHLELEGERIPAREGETVAGALLAADVDVFARGVKYHRARGPFCLSGRCSHCLVRVDGEPNVTACTTRVRDGMVVERQNAFPNVSLDLFSTIDWMYPKGMDHHSMFAGVPVVEKVVAKVARQMAGLGTLPDAARSEDARYLELTTDLLVIGGGVSGLAAASAAAKAGVSVAVVDEHAELGGRLRLGLDDGLSDGWLDARLSELREAGATLLPSTFAFGFFREDGKMVAAKAPDRRLLVVRPRAAVIATGSSELLPLFPNNDLAGIFGARGLARMIREQGVLPGERAVVCGDGVEAEAVAALLREVGCEVVATVGLTPGPRGHVVRARGRGKVAGAVLADAGGQEHRVRCDLIAVADHRSAFVDLARHAGAHVAWRPPHGFSVVTDGGATAAAGVFACGEVTGADRLAASAQSGEAAGRAAAAYLSQEAS